MKTIWTLWFLSLPALAAPTWYASAGESGGFTGGGDSVTVTSEGQVITGKWDMASAPRKEQVVGRLSKEQLRKLKLVLDDPALVNTKWYEPGNMSRTLSITEGGKTRSYCWSISASPPEPVSRAYQAILQMAAPAPKKLQR